EPVGIHRAERDVDADLVEEARDLPFGTAITDVVETDVEVVARALGAAFELRRAAAGGVVPLEHGGREAALRQVCGGDETAEPAADDGDVDAFRQRGVGTAASDGRFGDGHGANV